MGGGRRRGGGETGQSHLNIKRICTNPVVPLFGSFAESCQGVQIINKKERRGRPNGTCCWVHQQRKSEKSGYCLINEAVFNAKTKESEKDKTPPPAAARLTIIFWQSPRISTAGWWQPISRMSAGTNAAYDYTMIFFFWEGGGGGWGLRTHRQHDATKNFIEDKLIVVVGASGTR